MSSNLTQVLAINIEYSKISTHHNNYVIICRSSDVKDVTYNELGMVIEDLEHVLAPLKLLGSDA